MKWLLPRRRIGIKTRAEYHDRVALGNQRFDESTGQIYTETIAAVQTSDDRNWDRKGCLVTGPSYRDNEQYEKYMRAWAKHPSRDDLGGHQKYLDDVKNSKVIGLKGARSLQDCAIECILKNISDVTLEGIECLPHQIVRQLWYAVNQRCTMCFNTWRIFSKILHREDMPSLELFRYREVIISPRSALQTYTTTLTSESFDFLTSLCITTAIPVPDFLQLSKITNLGALEIVHTGGVLRNSFGSESFTQGIGDRVLRAWQMSTINGGAFHVLRILKLENLVEVTHNSLLYVDSFPALAVYEARGCRFGAGTVIQAKNLGWQTLPGPNVLEDLDIFCVGRASSMQNREIQAVKPSQRSFSQPPREISRSKPQYFKAGASSQTNLATRFDSPVLPLAKTAKVKRSKKQSQVQERTNTAKPPKLWDFSTCTTFARVGVLRNDSDLLSAGVKVGNQAVVDEQIVCSIPMASVCIGQTPPTTSRNVQQFTFLRVESRPLRKIKIDGSLDAPSVSGRHSTTKPVGGKHHQRGPTVMRTKKRKLDDVLGSFL